MNTRKYLAHVVALLILTLIALPAARADDATEKPKTGGFEITFSAPSPLTDRKIVAERFGIDMSRKPSKQDYSLASERFWLYVPPSYDPAKPMGILLFQYQGCNVITPDLSQAAAACDSRNIALISPLSSSIWGYRTAMCVDAIENLKKQYAIDPKRIYVYGHGMQAQRMTFGYPDIFSAGCYDLFEYWETIGMPWGGGSKSVVDSFPPAKWRDQGKSKPLVMFRVKQKDETEATGAEQIDKTIAAVVADYKEHHKNDPKGNSPKQATDASQSDEPKHGYQALSLGDQSKLDWDNEIRHLQKHGFSDVRRLEMAAQLPFGDYLAAMIDAMDAAPGAPTTSTAAGSDSAKKP